MNKSMNTTTTTVYDVPRVLNLVLEDAFATHVQGRKGKQPENVVNVKRNLQRPTSLKVSVTLHVDKNLMG